MNDGGEKLTDPERRRLLDAFDRLVPAIRGRVAREAKAEMQEIREARRSSSLQRARTADS